jgi:hypothetical protein
LPPCIKPSSAKSNPELLGLDFGPDGKQLTFACTESEGIRTTSVVARVWEAPDWREVAAAVKIPHDSKDTFVTQVWEMPGGRRVARFDNARAVAFSPDGEHLALKLKGQPVIQVRAVISGNERGSIRYENEVNDIRASLSLGGRHLSLTDVN